MQASLQRHGCLLAYLQQMLHFARLLGTNNLATAAAVLDLNAKFFPPPAIFSW